jgi:hypothetical protein
VVIAAAAATPFALTALVPRSRKRDVLACALQMWAYVAAYKTLTIFGPNGTALTANAVVAPQDKLPAGVTRITGMLLAVHGSQLTLLTRSSVQLEVDARPAVDAPSTVLSVLLRHCDRFRAPRRRSTRPRHRRDRL